MHVRIRFSRQRLAAALSPACILGLTNVVVLRSRADTDADKYFLPFKLAIDTGDTKIRGECLIGLFGAAMRVRPKILGTFSHSTCLVLIPPPLCPFVWKLRCCHMSYVVSPRSA
jgi:hypothetical protein